MAYDHRTLEESWRQRWENEQTFRAENRSQKPKYYVLDMFPYPSGAGLHVGHPLGYIATDIVSRYKRHQGFNVLHPMGWDAFGLPAEQYAIQTGQHPAVTTEKNIQTYKRQLRGIGLSFDWNREVNTSDPSYYKWTQWAFSEMFHAWFDAEAQKAKPIQLLVDHFVAHGNSSLNAVQTPCPSFSAADWNAFSRAKKEEILQCYRLAFLADLPVNWCPKLGTVLANDEVKDGLSVRGGHPVEQRIMKQWSLRVSAYAERLLQGLEKLDWSESIKEQQRNWIGKSEGAEVLFTTTRDDVSFEIFTTRPDTIFGVSFMVLAPESDLVGALTVPSQRESVDSYLEECKRKSERERLADVKKVSGVFTGSYAIHPFTKKQIPIWIGDYVLGGYGTGAIMAVPAHDARDWAFAKHFDLPILPVIEGGNPEDAPHEAKEGNAINSDFLNGLPALKAIARAIDEIEKKKLGRRKINYRLRDAIFSRQRYWGEPFPVHYKDGIPETLALRELPIALPEIDKYLPTESGEPPLGRAKDWKSKAGHPLELSTMPGFAGSSAYFFRYMDPKNNEALVDRDVAEYWREVDLYVGGSEHATGHLIYSRFWTKVLFDLKHVPVDEPFKKLVNQGLIQGRSNFVYRLKSDPNTFVSHGLIKNYEVQTLHVDVELVDDDLLEMDAFRKWRAEFSHAKFITEKLEHGGNVHEVYRCGWAVEKMSKSFFNVVNPDTVVHDYGADTLRLYEMFLGPLEQYKPWNMNGIEGVYRFLGKVWRWYHGGDDRNDAIVVDDTPASEDQLRVLHQTIDKVTRDVESLSFNTAVSQFMICANELAGKTQNRQVLESFALLLSPFAPHLAEELWKRLGHPQSLAWQSWPKANPSYLKADTIKIVVQVNGKLRGEFQAPVGVSKDEALAMAKKVDSVIPFVTGPIKKEIFVPGKLVNLVI